MTEEDYNLKRIEELLIELSEEAEKSTDIELTKEYKVYNTTRDLY